MADTNHVQKLMEGVAAWNQWRSENPGMSIDLRKADLRDADLSGANLREVNFVGCNLRDAVLDKADLSSAVLQGANLTSARLHAASFRGASITGATLNEVEASDADFREADFTGAVSTKADLMGANLSKAICKDSTFVEANFTQSDLTRTDFRDSNLTNASFAEASLEGADLRRSKLDEVSFKSSNLTIANLVRASLVHADFDGANLKHADLRRVVGLSCDQLTKAQNWEVTYRDATLACDATIPDPNRGVTIEVPAANLTLTGHAPTVDVTSTARQGPAPYRVTVETAEEIEEAVRQRFANAPAVAVAEAKQAKAIAIALLTAIDDLRPNNPEAGSAKDLLAKQIDALDRIIIVFEAGGDTQVALQTYRELLGDVLRELLKALKNESVIRGLLAVAAISVAGVAGVQLSMLGEGLVAGAIVGPGVIKAVGKIVKGLKKQNK